ncbi:MAG: GDSL-type esterase/lipase family protein [Muribaculaceae bacterium]|nr:GDSL-type esterase/lipase family protein [Muribaculaceae bacterium]
MKKGSPLIIILSALVILIVISLLPLSKWTGGRVKDFSLVSDILREVGIMEYTDPSKEQIDPALLEAMEEPDPLSLPDSVLSLPIDTIIQAPKAPRVGDMVVIEDYTTNSTGLLRLKAALSSGETARIAVAGDSWIEGDIFTQDLRHLLQEAYGGRGVGYVSMHTDFPGFRRSVKQGGKGWKTFSANKKADREWIGLSEQYGRPETGVTATATYQGTGSFGAQTEGWGCSRFLYVAPQGGTVSVKIDEGEWEECNITASDSVGCIEVAAPAGRFEVKTSSAGIVGLGVWLDDAEGVSLDCMSSRGFSGITLARINPALCRQSARWIDYSLVVLEFGINAMSASQKDYSVYSSRMVEVINHIRQCYPRADILVMGVGDRGEKQGGSVVSMATAPAMIRAQRDAARRAHCLFWDTREAMGGEGAITQWSAAGDINKDYIHMTHKGGARLARELFNALQHSLNQ